MDLKNIQLLFKQLVSDFDLSQLPDGFFAKGTGRLSPEERLTIYRKDFATRFIEVMQEGYPNLHILLGEDEFGDLIYRYILKHPSRHYDLVHLGEALPEFLKSDPLTPSAPFLPDLAFAERAITLTYQFPFLPPVAASTYQHFQDEDWQKARFTFQPSLSLITSAWPLPKLLHVQDMREEEFDLDSIAIPADSYLLVVQRADQGVDWRSLDEKEFRLLQDLQLGKTFCEVCELHLCDEDVANLQQWIADWFTKGLVTRIY